jgi:hypothetical protein
MAVLLYHCEFPKNRAKVQNFNLTIKIICTILMGTGGHMNLAFNIKIVKNNLKFAGINSEKYFEILKKI